MRLEKTLAALAVALLGTAPLPAQNQVSLTVDATMDIYRAGGYNDSSNGIAPVVFSFPARAWRTMRIPSSGGEWGCQGGLPEYGADGTTSGPCLVNGGPTNFNAIGPLSGYHLTDLQGALAGVFLEDALPASAAPALRFYVSNNSEGGIQTDFLALSPQIGQVFFIGDGLTGTGIGELQTFHVPPTATHLYLGYVDNCRAPDNTVPGCYSDNVGSLNVTVRLQNYVPDWVAPTLSTAPSARCCAAMAYDEAAQSMLLFGGGNGGISPYMRYADTWIWKNGWFQLSPITSPSARQASATAYDPTTGTVVLFGGADINNTLLAETWTWDGVTWTQQFPQVSPPALACATQSMTYDAATGSVVLFSCSDATGPLGDTWEWNGRAKTWTQRFPASSPSPRRAPLAYDAATKTVVLFGGDNGGGDCCSVYYNDTWTWDGSTWTQQFPSATPPARTEHMLAYDAIIGQVVLFGGYNIPGQGLDDTWTWDGSAWLQRQVVTHPSGRWGSSMDFDPLNRGLVLFGGEITGDPFVNETWLFVPVPVP